MGLSSKELNEAGHAICCVCGKEKSYSELAGTCSVCDRWVCKDCSSYMRQFPYGYICKNCQHSKRS